MLGTESEKSVRKFSMMYIFRKSLYRNCETPKRFPVTPFATIANFEITKVTSSEDISSAPSSIAE